MNSAYNQMPMDKQSQRLTDFVIAGQQYCFKRLFYGISIGPAAFSSFMSSIFEPLIWKKQKKLPIWMMFSSKTQQQKQCYKHSLNIILF